MTIIFTSNLLKELEHNFINQKNNKHILTFFILNFRRFDTKVEDDEFEEPSESDDLLSDPTYLLKRKRFSKRRRSTTQKYQV
jgi:hypothetical protein